MRFTFAFEIHNENELILKKKLFNKTNVVSVRPSGFFANLFRNISSIQKEKIVITNVSREQKRLYVHPDGIAQVCYGDFYLYRG